VSQCGVVLDSIWCLGILVDEFKFLLSIFNCPLADKDINFLWFTKSETSPFSGPELDGRTIGIPKISMLPDHQVQISQLVLDADTIITHF